MPAPAFGEPLRHARGDLGRLFDHVAHHPVQRFGRMPVEAVCAQVLHQASVEYVLAQWSIVDRGHPQVLAGEYPGPAAGRSAQVGGSHARAQQVLALVGGQQGQERFFQLQRRSRWRLGQQLQAWDPQRPGRAVARVGQRQQRVVAGQEADMQAWQARVFLRCQHSGFAQRRAQSIAEAARQPRQRLAGIRIRMLDPQVAEAHAPGHRRQQGREPVAGIHAAQFGEQAQLLPGEDQLAERQGAHQCKRLGFLAGDEQHVAVVAAGSGVAGDAGPRGALAQFGGQFRFEALAAVAEQSVHGWAGGAQ